MSALQFCMALEHAHARLRRKLDDELGTWHGIALEDLVLLDALARAERGRLTALELTRPLGVQPSAVLRQVLALEKTGLVERTTDADGLRRVVLRAPGRQLLGEAAENAEAIANKALLHAPGDLVVAARQGLAALAASTALELR